MLLFGTVIVGATAVIVFASKKINQEFRLLHKENSELKQEVVALRQQNQILNDRLVPLIHENNRLSVVNARILKEYEDIQQDIRLADSKLLTIQGVQEDWRNKCNSLQQENKKLKDQVVTSDAKYHQELTRLNQEKNDLKSASKQDKMECRRLESQLQHTLRQLVARQTEANALLADKTARIDALHSDINSMKSKMVNLANEKATLMERLSADFTDTETKVISKRHPGSTTQQKNEKFMASTSKTESHQVHTSLSPEEATNTFLPAPPRQKKAKGKKVSQTSKSDASGKKPVNFSSISMSINDPPKMFVGNRVDILACILIITVVLKKIRSET